MLDYLSQFSMIFNTWLDIVGRRPVIIIGTLGVAVTTALLGISNSLSEILLSRCLGMCSYVPNLVRG